RDGCIAAGGAAARPYHVKVECQLSVVLDREVERGAEYPRIPRAIDANRLHGQADEVAGPILLFPGRAVDLQHLPGRLQAHRSVTPDVHGAIDNHDVAAWK